MDRLSVAWAKDFIHLFVCLRIFCSIFFILSISLFFQSCFSCTFSLLSLLPVHHYFFTSPLLLLFSASSYLLLFLLFLSSTKVRYTTNGISQNPTDCGCAHIHTRSQKKDRYHRHQKLADMFPIGWENTYWIFLLEFRKGNCSLYAFVPNKLLAYQHPLFYARKRCQCEGAFCCGVIELIRSPGCRRFPFSGISVHASVFWFWCCSGFIFVDVIWMRRILRFIFYVFDVIFL